MNHGVFWRGFSHCISFCPFLLVDILVPVIIEVLLWKELVPYSNVIIEITEMQWLLSNSNAIFLSTFANPFEYRDKGNKKERFHLFPFEMDENYWRSKKGIMDQNFGMKLVYGNTRWYLFLYASCCSLLILVPSSYLNEQEYLSWSLPRSFNFPL